MFWCTLSSILYTHSNLSQECEINIALICYCDHIIIVVCCHHNEWFFARPKSYWSNFLLPSPSYCSTFFWICSLAEVSSWILETFLFYFDKFSLMSVKKDQTFSSHKRLVNVSLSSYLKVVCLRILVKLWRNKEHSHQKAKQDRQWC